MSGNSEESVNAIHSFFQIMAGLCLLQALLNELRKQKKYDESIEESRRIDIERVRQRMQQQYDQEAEEERLRIQEKKSQKLLQECPQEELANTFSHSKEKSRTNPADPIEFIQSKISAKTVVVFSKSWCAYSRKAKQALSSFRLKDENYEIIELDEWRNEKAAENVQQTLLSLTNNRSSPWVFADAKYIGGAEECVAACRNGSFENLLAKAKVSFLSTKH
uniref:Glutaredoxin domain-containing protein n=1 Tax=Ditylenchus dipsaci TaxID=166011 RepID=A0A915DXX3_9BILA